MHICFTFDNNYIKYVAVAISSIIFNLKSQNCVFHLIYSGVSERNINKLVKWLKRNGLHFRLYKVDTKEYDDCPCAKNDRLTKTAYYRINIPNILPLNIEKVLYLDPDVIVTRDLGELFNINIEHYSLCAVMVLKDYFNSGVLLLNLTYWRKNNIAQRVFSYIKENSDKIEFHDQDALNTMLQDSWKILPPKYNAGINILDNIALICDDTDASPYSLQELKEAYNNPVIIHYAGSYHFKPWYKDTLHPRQEEYLKYLAMTPYKNTKLKKNYILSIMKQTGNSATYMKNYIRNRINNAFILRKNIFDFLICFMYKNKRLRGALYTLLARILFINEFWLKKD